MRPKCSECREPMAFVHAAGFHDCANPECSAYMNGAREAFEELAELPIEWAEWLTVGGGVTHPN